MAERAGITIAGSATIELPRVLADRTRLAQILMNFGSNAIKYGKPGGHIALTLELRDPATVRIPIEGTGIGLTITKRLAEMMKGRVGFTSEVDRGSQFWVEIPVHRRAIGEQLPVAVAKGPAGFYRYLTKPVKVAELTSVLELLVRAKPAT
jgi:signal transduction histidine kinase